ncbi:MAG: SsrA-binding protein SmpB [Patescibacteria group bacterium]|nr:SsrA-binding protein SmpB [Patescibacteria group bacterium]MBU1877289.1 SsrA-binding protein SmpB [Patescibacteria group bacterium]
METIVENKGAYRKYQILEKIEAGISLTGREVKSIKSGRINLNGSYVIIKGTQAYLIGTNIPAYQPNNKTSKYEPDRNRTLLLKKSEIRYLIGKSQQKSLTLVPLKVYTKRGIIKLEFGIVKILSKIDKRESIKKKEVEERIRKIFRG